MEFWGIEVKPGVSVKCDPGDDAYIHLSQAALGDSKKDKGAEVLMSLKVDGPKIVIGTLSAEKFPQISYDLVFEKEFELSHNGKTSVYFCGYKSLKQEDEPDEFFDSDEDSEDELAPLVNGLPDPKGVSKPGKSDIKPKAKAEPAKAEKAKDDKAKDDKDVEDDDDEEDDDIDDDESGSDEDMVEAGDSDEDDDEDEEDSSEDEKEATPKKVETGKKRANDSAAKTPGSEKKAKLATPSDPKSGGDGKKGGHTATPHPNKAGAKTPANSDKSKQRTPKSGGQVSCKSCSKTFNSDAALQSHSKAKHSAGK